MPVVGNIISGSNDITYLDVQVAFDLSQTTPSISVTNLSQGPNLQNVTYWFTVYSPSKSPIHIGSFSKPDKIGVWTNAILGDAWPMGWKQIEWSGPPYSFSIFAQDSAGNVYEVDKYATIVPPCGNTPQQLNYFGAGEISMEVNCAGAQLFFEDFTNTSYQGLTGTEVAAQLIVTYPIDETGNAPGPSVTSNFPVLVPITYNGTNYQYTYTNTLSYDMGNGVSVVITYREQNAFSVLCNIDLCPLACEVSGLIDSYENGTCANASETQNKILQISPLMMNAIIGKMQPDCGIDVPATIDKIKKIGGFTCDCCAPNTAGIGTASSSIIGGYNFSISGTCGITGNVVPNGNNIVFNLAGKTYQFVTSSTIPTTAFTVTPATAGCQTTYSLNVSLSILSNDILTTIFNTPALVTLFNSIPTTTNTPKWSIDGKCIFATSNTFNYTYGLTNIPASGTMALLTSIAVGAMVKPLTFAFNQTNLTQLQTYLNGLGLGTFSVTLATGTVTIQTNDNTNVLSNLVYTIGSTTYIANFGSTNTGWTPIDPQFAAQQIINYLCALSEGDVNLANQYQVPTIVLNAANQYVSGTIPVGPTATTNPAQTLLDLINAFVTAENAVIKYVLGLGAVNCASISAIFLPNTNTLSNQSVLYGTKTVPGQGANPATQACAAITPSELMLYMLSNLSPQAQAAFCTAVNSCTVGQTCTPFNNLVVELVDHNTTCTNIVGINGTFS